MKTVRFHKKVVQEIEELDVFLKSKLIKIFELLAGGNKIGMPLSKPMTAVASGVHEIRIKDGSGQYRAFYYTKNEDAILVFHFFKKKTNETPHFEIKIAQSRLKEMV